MKWRNELPKAAEVKDWDEECFMRPVKIKLPGHGRWTYSQGLIVLAENSITSGSRQFFAEDLFKGYIFWLDESTAVDPLEEKIKAVGKYLTQAGYSANCVNIIALLGSIGEAGETVQEFINAYTTDKDSKLDYLLRQIATTCSYIDGNKKLYRDQLKNIDLRFKTGAINIDAYDSEIGDELYYLLAKMLGRGKSPEYYLDILLSKLQNKKLVPVDHANISIQ